MFATLTEGTFDEEKMARGRGPAVEFWRVRAQLPGYRGAVAVNAGDGRVLVLALWEAREQAQAAQAVLDQEAGRLLSGLWTTPEQVIAGGPVIHSDIPQT